MKSDMEQGDDGSIVVTLEDIQRRRREYHARRRRPGRKEGVSCSTMRLGPHRKYSVLALAGAAKAGGCAYKYERKCRRYASARASASVRTAVSVSATDRARHCNFTRMPNQHPSTKQLIQSKAIRACSCRAMRPPLLQARDFKRLAESRRTAQKLLGQGV